MRAASEHRFPNIAEVIAPGVHHGIPFFTMKLYPRGTLQRHFGEFQKAPRKAVELMLKVARALQQLHTGPSPIIHRDLKPSNILLDDEGQPHISDFGLAKLITNDEDTTLTLGAVGTPAYMSPEQAAGDAAPFKISPASDIWSLGVMLFELLVGHKPFSGPDAELLNVRKKPQIPAPRSLRPDLDPALERIIMKCLETEPDQRYASAALLAEDLQTWLEGGKVPERRASRAMKIIRRVARSPFTWVSLFGIAFISLSIMVLLYLKDPERVRERWEADFRNGNQVALIETKVPRYYRWAIGEQHSTFRTHQDGTATLESQAMAAIELVSLQAQSPFRLEAKIRMNIWSDKEGTGGIFIMGRQSIAGENPSYDLCTLGICEYCSVIEQFPDPQIIPNSKYGFVQSRLWRINSKNPIVNPIRLATSFTEFPTNYPIPDDQKPWRSLAIILQDDHVSLEFEGDEVSQFQLSSKVQAFQGLLSRMNHDPATFNTVQGQQAIGLFVDGANVSFRDVKITPLDK
jgi:hypothetical protein